MDTLRDLLLVECNYRMKDETMDMFLESMTELKLKANEELISYGALDGNMYILRSGIIRGAYFNGFKEMTYAFGIPGTLLCSYYTFYKDEPSFFKIEACCDSVFMKVTKTKFLELIRRSHDFAQWVIWMSIQQVWLFERKLAVVNGDAKERFEAMIENRPEIIENVPLKYIAAYIGVTPEYLSKVKRQFLLRQKK